jgi:hypothetical protein
MSLPARRQRVGVIGLDLGAQDRVLRPRFGERHVGHSAERHLALPAADPEPVDEIALLAGKHPEEHAAAVAVASRLLD